MDAQQKIKQKQSQYISKIQNLLENAPHAEYSNKNLLKLQKQQREKLRLLQMQHESLKASPGKGRIALFDSTLHSEQSLNAQYILRMEAETSAKKIRATDELYDQNREIEKEKAEMVN